MPNQRKKGKRSLGFYFTDEERDLLKTVAAKSGMNMSDFIKHMVKEIAKKEGLTK